MTTDTQSVDLVDAEVVEQFARAAVLAALISAMAYVSIPLPFSPVPFTLQVLFVFLAGLLLGPVWGPVSLLLYLLAGAVGLPVFAGGTGGLGVLLGQTGGYLWSYPIAAFLIGYLTHRGVDLADPAERSPIALGVILLAGLAIIYGMGVPWMAYVLTLDLVEAFVLGAAAFIPLDLIKLLAAVAIVQSGRMPVAEG